MTVGGAAFIAVTVLVAAMDGGLTTLVVAGATGGGAYVTTRRRLNRGPEKVIDIQRSALEEKYRKLAVGKTDSDRKALNKEKDALMEECVKKIDGQRWGNREMAAIVGVAGAACPLFGLAVIAGATSDGWLPSLEKIMPENKQSEVAPYDLMVKHEILQKIYASA
jgi:hypothetical protein